MAIYRAPRPDNHFTTIRNNVIRDERLSYKARGLLVVILSNADDWNTTSEDLARRAPDGRDAIQAGLRELEAAGYLVRVRRQDQRGRWSNHAMVYDEPQTPAEKTEQGALFDTPEPENPAPEKPAPENPALTEEPPKKDAPTERAPVDVVAAAVYEHGEKMGNYMAIRQVAGRALKLDGATPESVQAAMCRALDDSRPLTGQVVRDYLRSGEQAGPRNTHQSHWDNGGTFATTDEGGQ